MASFSSLCNQFCGVCPKWWIKNSYWIFSLSSAVALVGSWKCAGLHLPAALLLNIPVQASKNFDTDLLAIGRWGSWNNTAGLPPALVLLMLREISVLSTFSTRCFGSSVNVRSPLLLTSTNPNSTKNTQNNLNHTSRFWYVVHYACLSSTTANTSTFNETFVSLIPRS